VLAADLDLLNPPAEYEKNKHKLKRLVQSPNSFFMDVKCQACALLASRPGGSLAASLRQDAVAERSRRAGLLHHHDSVLAQPDGGAVRLLLRGAVPTDWRPRALDRGCVATPSLGADGGAAAPDPGPRQRRTLNLRGEERPRRRSGARLTHPLRLAGCSFRRKGD